MSYKETIIEEKLKVAYELWRGGYSVKIIFEGAYS